MVCPVSFIELGPEFAGDALAAEAFLNGAGVETNAMWTIDDTILAHRLWNDFQTRWRQTSVAKRPVVDVMIAAFASRFQGIITRNGSDFRSIAPSLAVIEPEIG